MIRKEGDCWIWLGARSSDKKYGSMGRFGRRYRPHIYFYLCLHGEGSIPAGMVLDHLCNNPLCVNPAHCEPKTQAANARRGRNTRITMEQAEEIRRRVSAGGTRRSAAAVFGLSEAAVSLICSGKRWNATPKPHRSRKMLSHSKAA